MNDNKEMLKLIGNTIFIVSPVIGFIPQFITRNIVFSPLLSLMLITSALLRFYYRRIEYFSNILIYQSIVVIATQSLLVYNFKYTLGSVEKKFYGLLYRNKKYGIFMANLLVVLSVIITLNLLCVFNSMTVFHIFGVMSIVLESSVGLMQLLMRRADKEVRIVEDEFRRLPKELFVCWIVGDLGKLYWMYDLDSPKMFIVPVVFQIGIDFLLMLE